MPSYLIRHPKRTTGVFSGHTVHYDRPRRNQDPFVWNDPFLHTFCHMSELRAQQSGDINFWVVGDQHPNFRSLTCDLVFTVESVHPWQDSNSLSASDPMVDNARAYIDHYCPVGLKRFKKSRRTLKANPSQSFQPLDYQARPVDLLPELIRLGLTPQWLVSAFSKGFATKPVILSDKVADQLRTYLSSVAHTKLTGAALQALRGSISELTA